MGISLQFSTVNFHLDSLLEQTACVIETCDWIYRSGIWFNIIVAHPKWKKVSNANIHLIVCGWSTIKDVGNKTIHHHEERVYSINRGVLLCWGGLFADNLRILCTNRSLRSRVDEMINRSVGWILYASQSSRPVTGNQKELDGCKQSGFWEISCCICSTRWGGLIRFTCVLLSLARWVPFFPSPN